MKKLLQSLTGLIFLLLHLLPASAQQVLLPEPTIRYEKIGYRLDSGEHSTFDGILSREYQTTIRIADAAWLRLHFGEYNLGRESYLMIKSVQDDGYQRLDARSLSQWGSASAFFNGGALVVELYVDPGDKDVFFQINEVVVGRRALPTVQEDASKQNRQQHAQSTSACDGVDERVPSNNPAVARNVYDWGGGIMSADCTSWIISNGGHLSAGHCTHGAFVMIEFNVPQSQADGTPVFAHPNDQYPVDRNSLVREDAGRGDDWAVFEVFPNSNTGLLPEEAQNAFFRLTNTTNFTSGHQVRVTGYGRDDDPPGPTPHPQHGYYYNSSSQTQQTALGPYRNEYTDYHWAEVDIAGGNSGSPMIDESTGLAFGIVTHGSNGAVPLCYAYAQSFEVSDVADAINTLPGLNTRYADVGHPEPLEDGTLFRPYDRIDEAISAVASGGIVSVAPGTYVFATSVNKNITLEAPVGAVTLNHDITVQAGATLTIAPGTELRFASGRGIKVYGTLNTDEVTLAASGSSWNGIYFYSGSSGTLTDTDITKVSASAAVIVNNASVTIENSSLENIRNSGGYDMAV